MYTKLRQWLIAKVIGIEIQQLSPQPGDIIVVRHSPRLPPSHLTGLGETLHRYAKDTPGVLFLLVPQGVIEIADDTTQMAIADISNAAGETDARLAQRDWFVRRNLQA